MKANKQKSAMEMKGKRKRQWKKPSLVVFGEVTKMSMAAAGAVTDGFFSQS